MTSLDIILACILLPVSQQQCISPFTPKLGRHEIAMKVQQLTLGFSRNQRSASSSSSSLCTSSSSNTTKRFRPLTLESMAAPDLESFNSSSVATKFTAVNLHPSLMQSGGTRWNPMPEQIKLLEALYQSGMRTPSPAQIDCITAELSKYGRIEGKNVFYWFQNHKARERQKQKRSAFLALARNTTDAPNSRDEMTKELHDGSCNCKRKCRSWGGVELDVEQRGPGNRTTLQLFPLHPEWKR